jgi:hypothetical protein
MAVRKNAKFLTAAEREDFVKACVLMKAEIVNPGAPAAQQYSRWDEYVAIHWMIQLGIAPGPISVNFGHGGSGAYSFLSWHRYFLYQFEQQLRSYVPGANLPYWDWTDPNPIMTDTFLGPNGTTNNEVRSGYFAADAPGTGTNPTPAPPWWPAGLTGWLLHPAFGTASGPLRRGIGAVSGLPTATDLRQALAMTAYPAFQNAVESGSGLTSFPAQQMHNGMHGWIGGPGQMSNPKYSPFDPIFYLHHCNIDRLWAMWQLDGHADEYPLTGGKPQHNRNDIMYPWTGGAAGYGTSAPIATSIPMPDFSAVGAKRNVDTLDFRTAFGYTYDTLAVIGIGLDRTGSMNALTPDPMVTGAPDVTKWEAAKRGVSAFLQDCESVQSSGSNYVVAGIKTFRRLAANDFPLVFTSPGYGLVKAGTSFSRSTFDSVAAGMTPGGSTPLADALLDVENTLVEPPFGHVPADERRYLAMLTDGLLTAGAPMSSIGDHSFGQTAVFAMGFGTGADVDYGTLQSLVDKGVALTTQQVFHGENAGTIDKFYSSALAHAIGFTGVIDPVLELFAGEHAHVDFYATSADDAFLITVQGMDFDDDNWTVHLHGPDGLMAHGDGGAAMHMHGLMHGGCLPDVTTRRTNGRLTLVLQRDQADHDCWVGRWRLMVAYKALRLDAMVMPDVGELLFPVAAGPVRGARYSRLLTAPAARVATRNVFTKAANRLDGAPAGNNLNDQQACNAVVNVYGRSRLRMELARPSETLRVGSPLELTVTPVVLQGNATIGRAFARLVAPARDLRGAVTEALKGKKVPPEAALEGSKALEFDPAKLLATLEKRRPALTRLRDEELKVAVDREGPLHLRVDKTEAPGGYHLGVYVEGAYCPEHEHPAPEGHDHPEATAHHHEEGSTCGPDCVLEPFTRLLTTSVGLPSPRAARSRKRT